MVAASTAETVHSISILKETLIEAPIEIAFEAILEELGPASSMPNGAPFPMVIEPRPGGRWYRDLGNDAGHFWGHVQVIKPPTLLEICGPLFMSYACANHVQYRLAAEAGGVRLKLTHRAIGQITDEHRQHVVTGWEHILKTIREIAERHSKNRKQEANP